MSFCRNDIVFRRVLPNHGFGGTIIRELIWLHGNFELFLRDVSHRRGDSAFLRKHCSPFITVKLFIFENAFSTRIIRVITSRGSPTISFLPFCSRTREQNLSPGRRFVIRFLCEKNYHKLETESVYWEKCLHFERFT